MAVNDFSGLVEGLESLGNLVHKIFNTPLAMFFIVLLIVWLMLRSLLKSLLSKIPFFQGDGDREVNAQGSMVANMLSLLCVLSIGWGARGKGPEVIVDTFAGPYGFFLTILLTILAGYGAYKNAENLSDKWKRFWTVLATGFVFFWLSGYQTGLAVGNNGLSVFMAVGIIAALIALAVNFARSRGQHGV